MTKIFVTSLTLRRLLDDTTLLLIVTNMCECACNNEILFITMRESYSFDSSYSPYLLVNRVHSIHLFLLYLIRHLSFRFHFDFVAAVPDPHLDGFRLYLLSSYASTFVQDISVCVHFRRRT